MSRHVDFEGRNLMKITKELTYGLMFLAIITSGAAMQIGWIAISIALGLCAFLCLVIATEMK